MDIEPAFAAVRTLEGVATQNGMDIEPALATARTLEGVATQDGYDGWSFSQKTFSRRFEIALARDKWDEESNWKLKNRIPAMEIPGMGSHTEHFHYDPVTEQKLAEAGERQCGQILIFPIRSARLKDGKIEGSLGQNEFYLDLAATIWFAAAHTHQLEHGPDRRFACLGDRYVPSKPVDLDLVPVVGYQEDHRRLYTQDRKTLNGSFEALIGKVIKF